MSRLVKFLSQPNKKCYLTRASITIYRYLTWYNIHHINVNNFPWESRAEFREKWLWREIWIWLTRIVKGLIEVSAIDSCSCNLFLRSYATVSSSHPSHRRCFSLAIDEESNTCYALHHTSLWMRRRGIIVSLCNIADINLPRASTIICDRSVIVMIISRFPAKSFKFAFSSRSCASDLTIGPILTPIAHTLLPIACDFRLIMINYDVTWLIAIRPI